MSTELLSWSILLAQILLTLAMACAVYRLLRGPRAQDRVLGLDTLYVNATMLLLALCLALTVQAGPVMRYMEATAQSLHVPRDYVRSVVPASPTSEQVDRGGP